MSETAAAPAPLHGVRILDLTTMILGPMAAQYLGDMGADVVKVEPPAGDLTRYIGPQRSNAMGAFYLNSNRNKRSVVLDIRRPEGLEVLRRLVAGADVVLHSIRTASADRLGLSYEDLHGINPRIIVCQVQGYSDRGVDAGRPAYDDVIQAASGLAMMQLPVAGEPRYVPSIIADKIAAVHAAYAVMAALLQRAHTGLGQDVRVPMMEVMASFNTVEHMWGAIFRPPLAPMGYVPVSTAARRPFRTLDERFLCVLPYTDDHWKRFCGVVADEALTSDARYATHAARQRDQQGFWDEVGRRVATRTAADWERLLTAADVPFARVNALHDLLEDPQLQSGGFWLAVDHPTEGPLRIPRMPIEMSGMPRQPLAPAPNLGEHTQAVLAELGLTPSEIDHLQASGITAATPRKSERKD